MGLLKNPLVPLKCMADVPIFLCTTTHEGQTGTSAAHRISEAADRYPTSNCIYRRYYLFKRPLTASRRRCTLGAGESGGTW